MKNISFRASRCAVAPSMSLTCALPVIAQPTTGGGTTGSGTTTTQAATDTRDDTDDRDYGWLGLLGLLGLAGLRKKTDDRADAHRTTSTSR